MDKDEMKNKISFALKDPILQQGFEIICKNLAELEKENAELKRDKEDLIFIRDKKAACMCEDKEQLAKAKELLNDFLLMVKVEHLKGRYETVDEAEQFLKEVDE